MRGKFITIEGCDGSGKSTQIELLKSSLTNKNADFVFTREPGGTEISEHIREIIINPAFSDMDMYTELLLYAAARRQHVMGFIQKKLDEGRLVFCDRFTHSTVAYQGYGRGVSREAIDFCNKMALGGLKIDLTIILDLPPEEAFARKGGADKGDRLECEDALFYKRVYEGYMAFSKDDNVVVIDARATVEQVHNAIMAALIERGIL